MIKYQLMTPKRIEFELDPFKFKLKNLAVGLIQFPLYYKLALYATELQAQALKHLRNYDVIQGQGADFGYTAGVASIALLAAGDSIKNQLVMSTGLAVVTNILEIVDALTRPGARFDGGDLLACTIGSFTPFLVNLLVNQLSKKSSKISNNL